MIIEWNKVTWYSKLIAVVVFLATFWIAFCLGFQYKEVKSLQNISNSDYVLTSSNPLEIGDLLLNLNSISDSRCPSDVQCIWAGRVDTELTISNGSNTETRNLSIDTDPIIFSGYKITLLAVTPYPSSKKQIKQEDYKVIINIENKM